MILYMIRHGETDWNKNKKIQGLTDIELNERGLSQANEMKEKLKDVTFDICLASPLKRALKTAQIITNGRCNIITNDLLLERNFGNYEGKTTSDSNFDIFKLWDFNENYSANGVESLKDLLKRTDLLVRKLKSEYNKDATILIVSHGSLIKGLYYSLQGYDKNTDFLSFHLENCEVYKCEIK